MTTDETVSFTRITKVEDGIERVSYFPTQRRFETPVLFQHGMWHGAWCWQSWQEQLAQWGWESHAYSLPGHAGSPARRPVYFCNLRYYLGFLKAEVERLPRRPVLVGHSLGGALVQWYLKQGGDALPAAVLLASSPALGSLAHRGLRPLARLDPWGLLLAGLSGSAQPLVRTPARAAALFLSPRSEMTPQAFFAHLSPESLWALVQHNPPFWRPPERLNTPLLVVAAGGDAIIPIEGLRYTAEHYGADFQVVPDAAHDLMLEHNQSKTVHLIHEWLLLQKVR